MLSHTTTTPEFDHYRVFVIRSKIADDDYSIDSLQIAAKIIDLEHAIFGSN